MITLFGFLPWALRILAVFVIGAFFTDYFNWWGW